MRTTKIFRWIAFIDIEPELAIAQFAALHRQVPLLYALLSVNTLAIAYTHLGLAPNWLAGYFPAILVSINTFRMVAWSRKRGKKIDPSQAVRYLRSTSAIGALLAFTYICWALALSRFGGEHEQTHVAIFVAITVVGCIFCLMPLPQAALGVAVIVTFPYLGYYFSKGDAVYAAIGVNVLLVTVVMTRVLLNSYVDFVENVRSKSEMARLNSEITVLAHTDALTSLPNRRSFFEELAAAITKARDTGTELAVGIIDLDRFKAVNDTMGHLVGDRLLEGVGGRLRNSLPPDSLISRLGGDEFAFCVPLNGEDTIRLANVICGTLSGPFELGGAPLSVGASCGIATLSSIGNGQGADALCDAADYALYNAKADRRGFATLYATHHEDRIRSEGAVEAALQTANLEAEMHVHFQPIMGDFGQRLVAVEALARWSSPLLGDVGPDLFIPLAERTGIVHRLTQTLFVKALEVIQILPKDVKLSFNLSANDLISPVTMLEIISTIRRSGVKPSRIVFEMTETAVLRDFEAAKDSIQALRFLGVQIALDDFGTGQSSLSHLRRLPIDKVKIDRSFVSDVDSPEGYDLLAAIIALCVKMKITCVAEGIETTKQLAILSRLGCHEFQGYYISKPLPAAKLDRWMQSRSVA